jgi:hypothetical protein
MGFADITVLDTGFHRCDEPIFDSRSPRANAAPLTGAVRRPH